MKTTTLLLILNGLFLIEISQAQLNQGGLLPPAPGPTPVPRPMLAAQEPTTPPPFDWATPRCYPETAKAYFLPAPPSSPIITILDPTDSNYNEARVQLASNFMSNRPSFPPPPAPSPIPMLPDLIDEVPSLIQGRFCRLAESDVPVCDACASLIEKLPIFKFDQELLDGFLAGVGL